MNNRTGHTLQNINAMKGKYGVPWRRIIGVSDKL